jgi:hypothetical protein
MNLKKGDTFWDFRTKGYNGVHERPWILKNLVTGGGDVYVMYRVVEANGDSSPDMLRIHNTYNDHRGKRYQIERDAYPTQKDALTACLVELNEIRRIASVESTRATSAIFETQFLLSSLEETG